MEVPAVGAPSIITYPVDRGYMSIVGEHNPEVCLGKWKSAVLLTTCRQEGSTFYRLYLRLKHIVLKPGMSEFKTSPTLQL